jgi:hypothetical protein
MISVLVVVAATLSSSPASAAIAPSKLGRFISKVWSAADARSDDALLRSLREAGLVRPDVPDDKLMAVFAAARQEHSALPAGRRRFNTPAERVRVLLEPYLSDTGRDWAVPIASLDPH